MLTAISTSIGAFAWLFTCRISHVITSLLEVYTLEYN
nr:MAG TPA: hypothetical protein [Caudoviricetes sp.]